VGIAPTKSEDQSTLRVDDFHLKVSLKTVSARRVFFPIEDKLEFRKELIYKVFTSEGE
jgi:hypothetical protein